MEREYTPLESANSRIRAIEKIIAEGVDIEKAEALINERKKLLAQKADLVRQSQFYSIADAIDDLHQGEYSDKFLPVNLVSMALRLFAKDIVQQLQPFSSEEDVEKSVDTLTMNVELLDMIRRLA